MIREIEAGELRTPEQLREAYEIERELADRLRGASRNERGHLYASLYDEFFRRVPLTPQLTNKVSPEKTRQLLDLQFGFLRPFLAKDSVFLEIGPGDCALSIEVCKFARQVYAVDVSSEITKTLPAPKNFQLILSDGCSVPLADESVNIAFSDQLMEHLHPDDALDQLKEIRRVLAPGGIYICITPNRVSGPHDISKYFDEVATGFHLREYTFSELKKIFHEAEFSRVRAYARVKGFSVKVPALLPMVCEFFLLLLPLTLKRRAARIPLLRVLLNIRLVGVRS